MIDLAGRVALVTNAGYGVGAYIAKRLARHGARVIVNDLDETRAWTVTEEIWATDVDAFCCAFDVTNESEAREGILRAERRVGPVEILVTNSGLPAGPTQLCLFGDVDREDWRRLVNLHVLGLLHCVRELVDGMCARGWGRIVTVASAEGRPGLVKGLPLYGPSKAAATGFTRHLALEVGASGVTANCVSLDVMDNLPTPIVRGIVDRYPIQRAKLEDVGAAIVYLASDEASWINGELLAVGGGYAT